MTRTVVESVVEEGVTVELAQRDEAWEISAGGQTVMASDVRGIEVPLAELAIEPWRGRDDISVLVAGLGMGHLLRAALDQPGVSRADVVEVSPALIDWGARCFGTLNGAATVDPRVHVHRSELVAFLRAPRAPELPPDGWFVILLDVDRFPAHLDRPGNAFLYGDEGLALLEGALRPGGVLGLWTTQRDDDLIKRLSRRLQSVSRVTVPGNDGMCYVYRGRRIPRRAN